MSVGNVGRAGESQDSESRVREDPARAESLRQRGVHLWFSGILTLASLLYVPVYARDGLSGVAAMLAALALLGGSMFVLQWRRDAPLAPVPHLIVAATWAAISISAWVRSGHYWDPVIEWLLLVPLVAATVLSARWVVFWTAAAILSTLVLWWARAPVPEQLAPRGAWLLLDRIGALVVVAVVTSAWARLRKRTLAELVGYSERLDRALRLRDDMIAQLSHAFRTPLTTITGVAEQLSEQTSRGARETLLDAAESLLVLVENLMLLTEPELSDSHAVRAFSAQRLAERVQDLLAGETASAEPILTIETAPAQQVRGPGRVLERALVWIGRAASEATDRRPAVRLTIVGEQGRQRWVLSGPGIIAITPALQQLAAHEVDLTAPAGGRRSELYLAVRLLQAAGVRVAFEEPALVLEVPVAEVATGVEDMPAGRVLLAEDHPVNRRIIEELLESVGWRVHTVGDGAALLAALQEPWDLLIVDCEMPVLDGIRAVARARANGYTGTVIMLTAHASEEVRRRALEAGADAVLIKPLRLEQLANLLARVRSQSEIQIVPVPPPDAAAPESAAIDGEALQFVLGLPDGPDLVQRFRLDAERRIACGQDASQPLEERITAWHALKGSAASIGFVGLAAAAAACEDAMRSGNPVDEPLQAAVRSAWRDAVARLGQSGGAAQATPGDFADQQQGADDPEPR